MVCIWSGFLHKKQDISLEVRSFSRLPILSIEYLNYRLFVSRTPLLQLRHWPFYGYSNFSITSSEIIMKMSDSNSIIYLLLLSLDDLSDNFKKKNANINNKTIFLMIYASRKKATLHKNTQPVITCYI